MLSLDFGSSMLTAAFLTRRLLPVMSLQMRSGIGSTQDRPYAASSAASAEVALGRMKGLTDSEMLA